MQWSTSWDISHDAAGPQSQANVARQPSPFPEWDVKSQTKVLAEWERLKKLIEETKELELSFRKYVVDRAFPDKHEGTNTIPLNNGYSLKAKVNYNYNLADNDTVEKALDRIAKIGNNGPFIADRLVSWKPNFLLTEYRQLVEDSEHSEPMIADPAKAILKEVTTMLTITEAAPGLEIKEPKGKKK